MKMVLLNSPYAGALSPDIQLFKALDISVITIDTAIDRLMSYLRLSKTHMNDLEDSSFEAIIAKIENKQRDKHAPIKVRRAIVKSLSAKARDNLALTFDTLREAVKEGGSEVTGFWETFLCIEGFDYSSDKTVVISGLDFEPFKQYGARNGWRVLGPFNIIIPTPSSNPAIKLEEI